VRAHTGRQVGTLQQRIHTYFYGTQRPELNIKHDMN
jgi:hypothetical protein